MKPLLSKLLVLLGLIACFPAAAGAELPPENVAQQPENYIVFFKGSINEKVIEDNGGKITQVYEVIQAAAIEINSQKAEELAKLTQIERVVKDNHVRISAQTTPWGHSNINLQAKQPSSLGGKGVKIAVIDTGVDTRHPDLRLKGGICVLDSQEACGNSYNDENGHGTHVAGIIGAQNNDIGIVGVAPQADVYAVKSLDEWGNGTSSTVMSGIEWAIKNNMDIINMSLTTPYEDLGIKAIIDKAYEKGILVVAASGNSGTITGNTETVLYPAKFPNIIAVSALGQKNSRVTTSSTGREVELSAPGYNIYSTVPGGYGSMTGTSMAAPFVSGLAALYKEKYPSMTNAQIRLLLQKNAKDIGAAGKDRFYGYGLVQADTLKIHPNQNLVTYQAEPDSVVNLNFQPLLQAYTGYNVYRNGQRIIQNGNEPVIQDYGLKGTLQYTVYPVLSGNEQRDKAIVVMANLENPQYQDLSNNLWYTRYMMYLHSEKIVNGYGNILMKPPRLVSRAEAVTMLARALNLDGTKRSTQFTDVPESSFASGYIKSAADLGIVYGLKDKSFKPNEPVTRAEMAILISRGFKLASTQTIAFKDINKSIAGFQEINNLAAANIAEGYMDGTFKPGEKMARYAFSVFLAKAHNEKLKK